MRRRPRATRATGGRGGYEPRLRIREREARVEALHARGWTEREMAAELGLSQPGVHKIIRRIEDRLLAGMHRERIRHLARMQMRTDHVYREAQRGWERSYADRHRRRQRRVTSTGPVPREQEIVEVWIDAQAGEPRFLQVQLDALQAQRTAFGGGLEWTRVTDLLDGDEDTAAAMAPREDES